MEPSVPPDQHGHGGGFFGVGGPDEAQLAALREALGDEAVEAMQRSLAASRNPRPLTDRERMILRENVAPVLHDLGASGAILPDIQENAHDDQGAEVVCARIQSPDGSSAMDISVRLANSAAERVVELAEQLQEWEVEELCSAGRSASWPECPELSKLGLPPVASSQQSDSCDEGDPSSVVKRELSYTPHE